MNKLRYYVLTSRHPDTLQRCLRSLPRGRTVVVINTLDEDYALLAKEICSEYRVESLRTDSDGTPGTGKNSLLKTFLSSDDEYAVCIDGDDYLTPYGVYFYDWVASRDKVPDLLVTHNEVYTDNGNDTFEFFQKYRDYLEWKGEGQFNELSIAEGQPSRDLESGIRQVIKDKGHEWSEDYCVHWATQWHNYREFMNQYSDISIRPTRMVFWTRKTAELANYSNELYIGEDTLQYLQMKQMYGRGEIDICYHNEFPRPTYIYVSDNIREPGSCFLNHPNDIDWVDNFFRALDKMPQLEYGHEIKPIDIFEYK